MHPMATIPYVVWFYQLLPNDTCCVSPKTPSPVPRLEQRTVSLEIGDVPPRAVNGYTRAPSSLSWRSELSRLT